MGLDRVEHGVQAVGTRRGEVVAEADFPDEIGFGVDDLARRAAGVNLGQQRDQAGHDRGVAVGSDGDAVGIPFEVQPDP